jgi:hypothetical protein
MDWRDALFLHWRADGAALARMIPSDLELDRYDGDAWVSIVAFRVAHARTRGAPAFAALRTFAEINVRTYVRDAEKSGVWFLSLDAADKAGVWAGRRLGLNYLSARIDCALNPAKYIYNAVRTDRRTTAAYLTAAARVDPAERTAAPNTLEHWLIERYAFFSSQGGRTKRGDVAHEPWPLHDAKPTFLEQTLLSSAHVVPLGTTPLAHASPGVSIHAWPLRGVRAAPAVSRSAPSTPAQ